MRIHGRPRRCFEFLRHPEELRGYALLRVRHVRHRCATISRFLRTTSGRRRLRAGVYTHIPGVVRCVASLYRRTLAKRVRVVAVVGSFGKTTTTRALSAVLGLEASRDPSWNSGTGQADDLLHAGPRARHAVIEVAISDKGQMEGFAHTLRPDIAVVTCIGSEHLTSLGTLESTRMEKAKMVSAVPPSGLVVLNGDDPNVLWMRDLSRARVVTYGFDEFNQVRATDVVEDDLSGVRFSLHLDGDVQFISTKLVGRHMIYAILAAIAVAQSQGCNLQETITAIEELTPTKNRLQPIQLASGVWLLLDAFKGFLETIDAALDTLAKLNATQKVVVLGDVEEPPGSQGPIYKALGRRLAEVADVVVFIGGKTNFNRLKSGMILGGLSRESLRNLRNDPHAIADLLTSELRPEDLVLIKGRSTQHLERVALILSGQTVLCQARSCSRVQVCDICPLLQYEI